MSYTRNTLISLFFEAHQAPLSLSLSRITYSKIFFNLKGYPIPYNHNDQRSLSKTSFVL